MSPERARQVANGILIGAGVTLAIVVWRQPALRRVVRRLAPVALREIRPVHIVAAMAALAAPAAAAGATVATAPVKPKEKPDESSARPDADAPAAPGALS